MSSNWQEVPAQENHRWLLERFVDLASRMNPSSVLDVGCGSGLLLKQCKARGIPASGIDQASPALEELRGDGLDVRPGSAYELPYADRSVDWVLLRHVPHHLEHPGRAFAEATRVAAGGVLIAEPCFDDSLACQRGAFALDAWEKAQHRRAGMIHNENHDLGSLLQLLPSGYEAQFDVEVQVYRRLRRRSVDDFELEAKALLEKLEASQAEREALQFLLAGLRLDGLSWNGSLCVALKRIA